MQQVIVLSFLSIAAAQESAIYDCGRLSSGTPLLINGAVAKRGDFPWHVGLFWRNSKGGKVYKCGGTLVSSKLVITAAHCCWDSTEQHVMNAHQLGVAAGKIYRPWTIDPKATAEMDNTQYSNVREIVLPLYYNSDHMNYADDIALLVLDPGFRLQPYLSPVCLNFERDFERAQLASGSVGKLAGWGLNSHQQDKLSKTSLEMRMLEVPLVPRIDCIKRSQVNFLEFITTDKFCAEFTNGTAVCKGDSGGGLVFESDGRHYLRGVISVKPPPSNILFNDSCPYEPLATFTNISAHRDFILSRYEDLYWHECGRASESMGGNREFPWHAHLYRDDKLLCGATLVRDDLVITAASAVWDAQEGRVVNKKSIDVTMPAGVERYDWNAPLDSQTSQVLRIAVAPGFNGSWVNNLAVLHVERFRLTPSIQPVCLEQHPVHPSPGDIGETLYGRGTAAREVWLVVLKEAQCDKTEFWFCAQFKGQTEIAFEAERCAGLVFPVKIREETRYFLRGVLAYMANGKARRWTRLDKHQGFLSEQWAVRL